jgi:hypothetical protein
MPKEVDESRPSTIFRTSEELREELLHLHDEQELIRAFKQRWEELGRISFWRLNVASVARGVLGPGSKRGS